MSDWMIVVGWGLMIVAGIVAMCNDGGYDDVKRRKEREWMGGCVEAR